MFFEFLHFSAIIQIERCHPATSVGQEYLPLPMVHDATHYFVLSQLPQYSGQLTIVRIPEFDACGMDGDEHKEFPVEEHVQGWVFIDQVLIFGFILVLIDQFFKPTDDAMIRFSNCEALNIVSPHVEGLDA